MAAVWPALDSVTNSRMIVVTRPPIYGMNRPKKTMTPSAGALGTPRTNRNSASKNPSIAAMTAVPRR